MADFNDKEVLCPFYKRYMRKRQMISCEGIPHSAASNLMFFENGTRADRYVQQRCCKDYMTCPVAKGIMEKYENL